MSRIERPRRGDVAWVRVFASCESVIHTEAEPGDLVASEEVSRWSQRARSALEDYFGAFEEVAGPSIWLGEEPEPSTYDSDLTVWAGSVDVMMTVDEWLSVAEQFCMEIEEGEILPPDDQLTLTLGILDHTGVTPAVAIEGTEEGFGHGGYEPSLLASFYVSLAMAWGESGD
jgi:hypothetical protein